MLDPAHLPVIVLIATPVVAGLLARLLRRPHGVLASLTRDLLDLISLRMVLRDTEPGQRATLLNAHRAWRATPAAMPQRTPSARRRSPR
ncbi:hypothetical protein ACIBQ1_26050 [Nonomuraea sp. NPDC050153]|uniref:hypothetical protein n=1 Tax=Nonomuraea sp. NPDC050153 TaxID=3364359 RepID=UPI0037A905C5